jgi:hypothetical protein
MPKAEQAELFGDLFPPIEPTQPADAAPMQPADAAPMPMPEPPPRPARKPLTPAEQELAIEQIVEHVVTHTSGPDPELPLSVLRDFCRSQLRMLELPDREEAWLDELIRELAEFHEVAINDA